MTALLEINNLTVTFGPPGGFIDRWSRPRRLQVLDQVSLSLAEGETLGLVGESGSGKTTLARAALGLVPASAGTIIFNGQRISVQDPAGFRRLHRDTAMMFQDAVASLSPRMTVAALITEPFVIHRISVPDRRTKARELLDMVGLPASLLDRYPHELSGGQARRVGVARALALRPKLVIADEATAGLDVSVQGEILNLLNRLKAELGLSYILVTHNLAMVRHVSDRLAIMYMGQIVETGLTGEIFRRPRHPYTRALLDAEPIPDPRRRRTHLEITGEVPSLVNRPAGCPFHPRCAHAQDICRVTIPKEFAIEPLHQLQCHCPIN